MDCQWNYQEQPEHGTNSLPNKKGFNAKHGRNSRGMGSQGLRPGSDAAPLMCRT